MNAASPRRARTAVAPPDCRTSGNSPCPVFPRRPAARSRRTAAVGRKHDPRPASPASTQAKCIYAVSYRTSLDGTSEDAALPPHRAMMDAMHADVNAEHLILPWLIAPELLK